MKILKFFGIQPNFGPFVVCGQKWSNSQKNSPKTVIFLKKVRTLEMWQQYPYSYFHLQIVSHDFQFGLSIGRRNSEKFQNFHYKPESSIRLNPGIHSGYHFCDFPSKMTI